MKKDRHGSMREIAGRSQDLCEAGNRHMNKAAGIFNECREDIDRINREMEQTLSSRIRLIEDMAGHTLLAEGKRLRPLLFIECCRLFNYHGEGIYLLSTVFEYIHAASLLHDDVLDNAQIRRKRPSANHVWGNQAAVLEGDFLYSNSISIAMGSHNWRFIKELASCSLRMSEGQMMELIHTHDWDLDRDHYIRIIEDKTAALISCACRCASMLSGADMEEERAISDYGMHAGMAFQIVDDLLDYSASEEALGKPAGKDLREGKITLPLIYALEGLDEGEKNRYRALFREDRAGDEDYRSFIQMVRDNGVLERIQGEARDLAALAESDLDIFPDSRAKRRLIKLSRFFVDRAY